jgi:hypothetical protein
MAFIFSLYVLVFYVAPVIKYCILPVACSSRSPEPLIVHVMVAKYETAAASKIQLAPSTVNHKGNNGRGSKG